MSPKCFIASAFDRTDVDELYNAAIRPVLRALGISPLRVDRVEHNEDIDDKIFELLDAADFCIADLTYARPSVYYEAGYAFGHDKPVIYLARADHFKAHADDIFGNLRVHFDLQMKNVISWTTPSSGFCKQLRSRIRHVIRPLQEKVAKSRKQIQAEHAFARLSEYKKIAATGQKARRLLRAYAYKIEDIRRQYREPGRFKASRVRDGTFQQLYVLCVHSVTKTSFAGADLLSMGTIAEARDARAIDLHCMYVALRKGRSVDLAKYLPSYSPTPNGAFVREDDSSLRKQPVRTTIHVLRGMKSVGGFAARFRQELEAFNLAE
jgi:nucleoside 2-deoxyribosyltransferase